MNDAPARVLVTGGTHWQDRLQVERLLADLADRRAATGGSFRVISGMASGADEIARSWALANEVHLLAEPLAKGVYPGPMHSYNKKMLSWAPELVLAFKDDFARDWQSPACVPGTEHMCRIALGARIPVLLNGAEWLMALDNPGANEAESMDAADVVAQAEWGSALVSVVQGDITAVRADVIVNAANSSLLGGGGVDGAIHRAAGPDLLAACREVVERQGGCKTGEAVITRAGLLPAAHVVHTVGPVFTGDKPLEHDALLARCYCASLRLGAEAGATAITFPNISTGVYRFPKDRAASVACDAVRSWLGAQEHGYRSAVFVCFDPENVALYRQLLDSAS